ncbi:MULTISPECIES: AlpA family phage regulatory protein [unclassified Ruegeria]|uniref:helix-turn-helix transcriptional regulator n=1 Tax=unclassified Ruegeria TaxID=2625375 RepID=UPI00148800E5
MNKIPENDDRLLRLGDVEQRTGLKRSTIYEKMARPSEQGGGFPHFPHLGWGAVGKLGKTVAGQGVCPLKGAPPTPLGFLRGRWWWGK